MKKLCCGWLTLLVIIVGCFMGAADSASMESTYDTTEDFWDAAQGTDVVEEEEPDWRSFEPNPEREGPEIHWMYGVPMTDLYALENMLVNKDNILDKDYEPRDLVKVMVKCATSAAIYMERIAAEALVDMFNAAKDDGHTLYLKSGYRSYGTQKTMYTNRLQSTNGTDDGVVAPPGASEHQTGLSCDILNKNYAGRPRMTPDFTETAEAQWMAENCAYFGFILRYPEDKTDITQFIFEPWHFRYLGRGVAGYIMRNELTLEEFTEQWKEAVLEFESRGGSIEEQIAFEQNRRSTGPASFVLDLWGEDGDAEVSLSF